MIVPWAAGGSTDAIARAVAQRLSETMGQPVIVLMNPICDSADERAQLETIAGEIIPRFRGR